jgi:hypothetical protein
MVPSGSEMPQQPVAQPAGAQPPPLPGTQPPPLPGQGGKPLTLGTIQQQMQQSLKKLTADIQQSAQVISKTMRGMGAPTASQMARPNTGVAMAQTPPNTYGGSVNATAQQQMMRKEIYQIADLCDILVEHGFKEAREAADSCYGLMAVIDEAFLGSTVAPMPSTQSTMAMPNYGNLSGAANTGVPPATGMPTNVTNTGVNQQPQQQAARTQMTVSQLFNNLLQKIGGEYTNLLNLLKTSVKGGEKAVG